LPNVEIREARFSIDLASGESQASYPVEFAVL
jgi:hypothetical protein